jgi:hypothetical protein
MAVSAELTKLASARQAGVCWRLALPPGGGGGEGPPEWGVPPTPLGGAPVDYAGGPTRLSPVKRSLATLFELTPMSGLAGPAKGSKTPKKGQKRGPEGGSGPPKRGQHEANPQKYPPKRGFLTPKRAVFRGGARGVSIFDRQGCRPLYIKDQR